MATATTPRPSTDDRIRAALWFADRGFGIFSVWSADERGTCRCPKGKACDSPGKHPVTPNGFRDATTDPARIRTLLAAGSEPNYGLVCPEGVFALDVDGDGIARLVELEARHGPLPATLTTATANGRHIFLRWPDGLPRPIGQLFGYVTRWGSGSAAGYVIGPRSVHPTGAVYLPSGDAFEIAELPEAWARASVERPDPDAFIKVDAGGYQLPEPGYAGSRYEAIRAYIASRYMRGMDRAEILAGVLTVLAPRFADPLPDADLRSRFDRAWKGTKERLGPPTGSQKAQEPRREIGPGIDAADLLELDLPPLRWVVPGLIPEGTTILAAPPKVGKSCLIYQIAVEASIGGELLGKRVLPGSVLYLALEDGKRRGQDRLRVALAGRTMPRGRLEVRWNAHPIGKGLEEDISAWLESHPDAVMVAVDTLGKVRPQSDGRRNAYEIDVADLARLQDLFRDKAIALVIVHHARKDASDDDFLASVSGTYGITGSADTIVVVKRKRLERFGTIYATGRDIDETQFPVEFSDGRWTVAPEGVPAASFERTQVYQAIERSRHPIFPKAIAEQLGMDGESGRVSVQQMVEKLVADGAIVRVKGGYVKAGASIALSIPDNSDYSPSNQSNQGESRTRARDTDPVETATRPADTTGTWASPCHFYTDHQHHHRQGAAGWYCDICTPEGGF